MKMTKFFAAMLAVAALTLTACEKKNEVIIGGEDTEETLNIPTVAAPAAGQHPMGIVLHLFKGRA